MDQMLRQTSARIASLLAAATLGMGMIACNESSITGGDGVTNAAGVPSQVVYVWNSVAGGQRLVDSLVIDSASGQWSQSRCGPVSATVAMCDRRDFRTETGTMEPFLRLPLFERARRADFQALRREYRRSGVVPPDVTTHILHVVQNGQRRTVSWESGAAVPGAIATYQCALSAARGFTILCAD